MSKKVFYDAEAREKVLGGAKALYDAVKVTFGPKGRNVVIEKSYGAPTITHDGVTVAEAVDLGKQLVQGLFALVVAAELGVSGSADGVNFVDEDDCGGNLCRLLEQVADAACTDADEHFHKVRTAY